MISTQAKDESRRLQALAQYEALQSPSDPGLEDITRLAAQICNAPAAALCFLDADRLTFRARIGLDVPDLPRAASPSADPSPWEQAALGTTVLELTDTRRDPQIGPQGLVLAGRSYRFFAGAPLSTPEGVTLGTLFILDAPVRKLSAAQLNALTLLSRQIIATLELGVRVRQMDRAANVRHRVETALTVERNFVSAVLDTVDALVAVLDTAGRIVRFNRACEEASGYDIQDLVGRHIWDKLIPKKDIPESIETFERLRAGGFPAAFENHWRRRDGTLRRIAWSATALVDSQAQVAFIIATGIDVTEQRVAEDTMRESEARYRELVEGSLGMVSTHDLAGRILSMNAHGAQILGRSLDAITGHTIDEFMPADRAPTLKTYLEEVEKTGESQGLLHLRNVSGEVRVVAFRNRLIRIAGRAPYVLGFAVDITEQVRAEDQLRSLMRQSNSVLESIGDGIYGIDLEGRGTVVNPAAAQMLGYQPEELLGRVLHDAVHHTHADGTPYPAAECPIRNSLTNLDTVRVANDVFWRKDGTSFPVEYVARPQLESSSKDGRPSKAVGVVVAFTDTTERRALDRMKDEFISTISHELRTPLTSLRAALGLVSGGALTARPEKMQKMLEIAIGNTDRLIRLVNDILDLERIGSGKAELHYTMCSVDDLLRQSAGLQHADAARVGITLTFAADGVNVWADPDRILQTLTNLIANAIKFSPAHSRVHLSAARLSPSEAQIEVADQGRGIPADKLELVFQRFQQVDASDSRVMGGSGLGLAICRSIVAQHGGRIWATRNHPDTGTTFHFTLPTRPSNNLR